MYFHLILVNFFSISFYFSAKFVLLSFERKKRRKKKQHNRFCWTKRKKAVHDDLFINVPHNVVFWLHSNLILTHASAVVDATHPKHCECLFFSFSSFYYVFVRWMCRYGWMCACLRCDGLCSMLLVYGWVCSAHPQFWNVRRTHMIVLVMDIRYGRIASLANL